jgi:hypothetical protein
VQRNYCVTKNNLLWSDFMFEEDAKELAISELGEKNE